MYYRLDDNIALRKWADTGYACYEKGTGYETFLWPEEAEIMLLCDSEHDIEANDTVMQLILRKLIMPCEKGEKNSEWSSLHEYENRHFKTMMLMITGKCNYNCLHCYNAADNSALRTELSLDEICSLLDQAKDCGIRDFWLTGGEPMIHKNFPDIIREIYKRGMSVVRILTNGYFITQEILDEMKAIGCDAELRMSFDGIGMHDWLRNSKGAEQKALETMKLCIDNGFKVAINQQVNRRNLHTLMPTVKMLNDMGVDNTRIVRTTEVPRWLKNVPDGSLNLEEFYGHMLEFAREYMQSGMKMKVNVWHYLYLSPQEGSFYISPVKYPDGEYYDSYPCCAYSNYIAFVSSSGEVMPCPYMAGSLEKLGMSFGDTHKTPLKELLKAGPCVDLAKMTVGHLKSHSNKCGNCQYFKFCGGGCRAFGALTSLLTSGKVDFTHEDMTKCYFFENGWYRKVTQALSEWNNLSKISCL
ncbi:MAG: radical SAM protein [Synergistaceae bacterium]|nr:radical SAM protein [Synergistaceae bacterium]